MDIRPILSTLRRHKTAAALIVLEIALSCAIICNAVFLIAERNARMDRPSGMAEEELAVIQFAGIGRDDNARAITREDLAALRAIPGVKAATITNQVPYGNSSWNSSINLEQEQPHPTADASMYLGDEQFLEATGVRLVAGRFFNADELVDFPRPEEQADTELPPVVVLTKDAAERIWPGEDAVGKTLYTWGDDPKTVVGVVDSMLRPNDAAFGGSGPYVGAILPVRMPYTGGRYLIRTEPGQREAVLKQAVEVLQARMPNRILLQDETMSATRADFYAADRSMAWLLVAVIVALLVVTALGIVGLASFWVQQRTKQIGVRRALGATRGQILRYFQTENFLLATIGIVIGMIGAYGINQLLMGTYELPRLPLAYLPVGAVALWLLGQLSVLGPARRAAAVPPAVATRSV
ncbi:ABC transporter permease [Luteimonas pelagia]